MSTWPESTAKQYADLGEQAHTRVLLPVLEDLAGDLSGARMLDFGCGDGSLGFRLARRGVTRCLSVDENPQLLEEARRNLAGPFSDLESRVEIRRADDHDLPAGEKFDLVLCSLVLMMAEARVRLNRALAGLLGSLSENGRLLVTVTHPCFRRAQHRAFQLEMPDTYSYWASGTAYEVIVNPPETRGNVRLQDYHWTLEDYFDAIRKAGGIVADLRDVPAERSAFGKPLGDPAYLVLGIIRHPCTTDT